MTRRERLDAAIEGVGLGNVAPKEEADMAGGLRDGINVPASEEGFDLRRHANGFAVSRHSIEA